MSASRTHDKAKKSPANGHHIIYPELAGRYKLSKTIGKGNFAKVKSAKHIPTKITVAIKIIKKKKMNQQSLIKVNREISILKEVSHPNISNFNLLSNIYNKPSLNVQVQLFEVIESEQHIFIVTELANGGELFDHLVNNGRMKESVARVKFLQLISALNYCHNQKIVHRDIKAENILLDDKDNIKIADFGFANHFSTDSKLDTYCGSPPYAAPELFQAKKYVGPEVDVWSLGVILFTLVTGSLPFDGDNITELRECVLAVKFKVPYYVSAECESLIKHMLTKNPDKRYTLVDVKLSKWVTHSKKSSKTIPVEAKLSAEEINPCEVVEKDVLHLTNRNYDRQEVLQSITNGKFDSIHAHYLICRKYNISQDSSHAHTPSRSSITDHSTVVDEPQSPSIPSAKIRTVSEILNLRRPFKTQDGAAIVPRRPKTEYEQRDSLIPIEKDLSAVPQKILKREPKVQVPQVSQSANEALTKKNLPKISSMTPPSSAAPAIPPVEPEVIAEHDKHSRSTFPSKPRHLFLAFNVKKVKKLISLEEIVEKLHFTLKQLDIQYLDVSDFDVQCFVKQKDNSHLIIDIEIVRLNGNHHYGFKAKRIKGTAINYKNILETIYSNLDLWKK